jgi:soluble lytic murein transglycosylase-like protein
MTLTWLCVALLLLAVLVFIWTLAAAAGAAEVREYEETVPVESPPVHIIYPGIPLEDGFQDYITGLCKSYGVSVPLVLAIIARESDFDSKLVDDNGQSFGLMQIQPQWHRERMRKLGVVDLLDPAQNVQVGIDYLAELLDIGKGEEYAVMFYNGGEIHANAYYKRGEMSHYCADVMRMRDCIESAGMVIN